MKNVTKRVGSLFMSLVMCLNLGVSAFAESPSAAMEQEPSFAQEEVTPYVMVDDLEKPEMEILADELISEDNKLPEEMESEESPPDMLPEEENPTTSGDNENLPVEESPVPETDQEKTEEETDPSKEESEPFSSIWTEEYLQQYSEYREAILNEANDLTEGIGEYDYIDFDDLDSIDEEFLLSMYSPMLLADGPGNGQITSVDTHYYNGTQASGFTVSYGGTNYKAYCMQHQNMTSPSGTNVNVSEENRESIVKLLYYGWGGPGQWSGFTSSDMGTVCTALALSWAYSGVYTVDFTYAFSTGKVEDFYYWAMSQPDPRDGSVSFSATNLTAKKDSSSTIQKTSSVRLNCGNPTNYVQIAMKNANVTLVNETRNQCYGYGSTATIYAGDYFHLEAPLSYSGKWSATVKGGRQAATAYKATTGVTQDVGFLMLKSSPDAASITVQFADFEPNYASVSVGGSVEINLLVKKTSHSGTLLSGAVFEVSDGKNTYTTAKTNANGETSVKITYPRTSVEGAYVTNPEVLTDAEKATLKKNKIFMSYAEALAQAQADWLAYRVQNMSSVTLTITETVAPSGYVLADPVTKKVNLSGATVSKNSTATNRIAVISQTSTVEDDEEPDVKELKAAYDQYLTLMKQDAKTERPLAGAEFAVDNIDQPNNNPLYNTEDFVTKVIISNDKGFAATTAYTYQLAYRWYYCNNWDRLTAKQQEALRAEYANRANGAFYPTYNEANEAYQREVQGRIAEEAHTYQIVERKAPEGYFQLREPVTVTIKGRNSAETAVETIPDDAILDTLQESRDFEQEITLHKFDPEIGLDLKDVEFEISGGNKEALQVKTDENGLVTVTYQYSVTSKEYTYVTDWDRLSDAQKEKYKGYYRSEKVAHDAAVVEMEELVAAYKNVYTIEELKAPNGYYKVEPFTIEAAGEYKETTEVPNEHFKGTIGIVKSDSDRKPLKGVTFALYSTEPTNGQKYNYQGADYYLISEKKTEADGTVEWTELNAYGKVKYLAVETATLEGYSLLASPIEIGAIPKALETPPTEEYTGLFYEENGMFYFFALTYNVGNNTTFDVPMTGGNGFFSWFLGGMILLAFGIAFSAYQVMPAKKKIGG